MSDVTKKNYHYSLFNRFLSLIFLVFISLVFCVGWKITKIRNDLIHQDLMHTSRNIDQNIENSIYCVENKMRFIGTLIVDQGINNNYFKILNLLNVFKDDNNNEHKSLFSVIGWADSNQAIKLTNLKVLDIPIDVSNRFCLSDLTNKPFSLLFDMRGSSSYINDDKSNTNTSNTNIHKYNNIFMKIDIEGHEFRLLSYLIDNNHMNKIKQLIVEIHSPADIQMFPDYFAGLSDIKNDVMFKLLNNINKTHTLVHFHVNNGCNTQVIDNIKLPHVFECTYIRNDFIKEEEKIKNNEILPTRLDMKNIKDKPDFYIDYYPFCNM